MSRDEILETIKKLAPSQGFYSRLWQSINEGDPQEVEDYLQMLEAENLKDPVDLILFLEC